MNKNIAIYGAQLIAGTIYTALIDTYDINVSYFIVSDIVDNPKTICGVKVISLKEYIIKNIYEQILIAVPEEHQQIIADELNKHGRNNLLFLTSELRNQILESYYRKQDEVLTLGELIEGINKSVGKEFSNKSSFNPNIKDDFLKIYMARSSKDKSLNNKYDYLEQIEQIQAGAVLDENIGILRDDTGDNISHKNRNYCELTALYWAWKNTNYEYTGLYHYRRTFCLDTQGVHMLSEIKPDVILPYPTIHIPNISSQYVRYISYKEWEIMRNAVLIKSPEIKDCWNVIWEGRYFYNYNMMIASKKVLDNYCSWLFDILSIVEKLCIENKVKTSSRYAGYMGEILSTIYFIYHRKNLKIVHTGVEFLV